MTLSLLSGSFFVSYGQEIPVRSTTKEGLSYKEGERIRYIVHYDWGFVSTDVGTGEARLSECDFKGERAFLADVTGQTTKLWDRIFKVREHFQSWFTCDGLVPMKFLRDTQEDRYVARNKYDFLWDRENPCIEADVYSSSSGQRNLQIPLDRNTYDLLTLFYLARNMDFDAVEPGVKHPMTFAIDDDVYHVYFILIGREQKKVKGLGTINTIKFAARLIAGEVFKGDQDMFIWVSDDDNRVPVLFEAPIWVGKVSGRLVDYSGLKYELKTK